MRWAGAVACVATALALTMVPTMTKAQLSPGDLTRAHAALEGVENCRQCHESGRGQVAPKCLLCHRLLNERVEAGQGLHSLPEFKECQSCHVEHQGRGYELIWWKGGRENFDHARTGYPLDGAHARQTCEGCHQASHIVNKQAMIEQKVDLARTFLGLNVSCLSCHADEHRGQLATTCRDCHGMAGWTPAPGFNHDRTKFVLTGRHVTTVCNKCHTRVPDGTMAADKDLAYLRFRGLTHEKCLDCHKDVHGGKFGAKCESCHTTADWGLADRSRFDHSRTRFPLQGKHVSVTCAVCHKPGRPRTGMKFAKCMDCHSDTHKGEFAHRAMNGACEECHTVSGYTPALFSLAQHEKTEYPLHGAHLAVICNNCHPRLAKDGQPRPGRFTFKSRRCTVCHSDAHGGTLTKLTAKTGCELCHADDHWGTIHFDHRQTDYPLDGKHAAVSCRTCHRPAAGDSARHVLKFVTLGKQCSACHQDIHAGQFRKEAIKASADKSMTFCERCHTPQGWHALKFNHDTDTEFPLEGAHRNVACRGCHKSVTRGEAAFVLYKVKGRACRDCHGSNVTEMRKSG